MKELEQAADAALARYLAATPAEEEPTRESQRALWIAVVRATLEAIREPNEDMCEAGAAYYHDNYQPGHAKEQTTAPLVWRTMIDKLLA